MIRIIVKISHTVFSFILQCDRLVLHTAADTAGRSYYYHS